MHQQRWEKGGECDYKGFSEINLCPDEILLCLDCNGGYRIIEILYNYKHIVPCQFLGFDIVL